VAALERTCARLGYPRTIRVDQGSEFISRDLDLWAYANSVTLDFSRPGKPTDTDEIEQSLSRGSLLFSECPRTTAWQRAGLEVKAPSRSPHGRPSFAASVGARRPLFVQPSVIRR
jgi:transposase InsO family protein